MIAAESNQGRPSIPLGLSGAMAFGMMIAFMLAGCAENPTDPGPLQEYRSDHILFFHATDWFLDRDHPDFNPDQLVMVEAKELRALVGILLYKSSDTAEALLESDIRDYQSDFADWDENKPSSSWGRFEGKGRRFEAAMKGVRYHLDFFVTEVDDGVFLQVNEMVAVEDRDAASPGLETIRSTLQVVK
jgi:hypothetical protein